MLVLHFMAFQAIYKYKTHLLQLVLNHQWFDQAGLHSLRRCLQFVGCNKRYCKRYRGVFAFLSKSRCVPLAHIRRRQVVCKPVCSRSQMQNLWLHWKRSISLQRHKKRHTFLHENWRSSTMVPCPITLETEGCQLHTSKTLHGRDSPEYSGGKLLQTEHEAKDGVIRRWRRLFLPSNYWDDPS